ncbi:hypothetical protein AB6A40_005409 [Gnathostoma spinigerum]|uniref:Uncharacterized protein n=1 Tax=Gnathostoma spinigerum TaxID=75299 RepID=A0ABD6EGH8_9BILA
MFPSQTAGQIMRAPMYPSSAMAARGAADSFWYQPYPVARPMTYPTAAPPYGSMTAASTFGTPMAGTGIGTFSADPAEDFYQKSLALRMSCQPTASNLHYHN